MITSDLITKLQQHMDRHGDLPIYTFAGKVGEVRITACRDGIQTHHGDANEFVFDIMTTDPDDLIIPDEHEYEVELPKNMPLSVFKSSVMAIPLNRLFVEHTSVTDDAIVLFDRITHSVKNIRFDGNRVFATLRCIPTPGLSIDMRDYDLIVGGKIHGFEDGQIAAFDLTKFGLDRRN